MIRWRLWGQFFIAEMSLSFVGLDLRNLSDDME